MSPQPPGPSLLRVGAYDESSLRVVHRAAVLDLDVPECRGALMRAAASRPVDVPRQIIAELTDVVCAPRQVLIKDGALLPDTFRRISPRHAHVQLERVDADAFAPKLDVRPRGTIVEPCFYLDGEHTDHFGHLTLEVLSRLWAYTELDLTRLYVVTFARPDARIAALLAPFGISPERILFLREPMLMRQLFVASQAYVLEQSVAAGAFAAWARIADFHGAEADVPPLYVSRTRWRKQRNLLNEAEVEAAAVQHGYRVVHPEELSVPEQIRLFRGARTIAGPSGSGLYNCVYCREEGARLILASSRFVTPNDALINCRTGSRMLYVTGPMAPGETSAMLGAWTVDVALASDALKEWAAAG